MKKISLKKFKESSDTNNIYKLDGTVPLSKAIPFGLQHVLAMFVANITPIMLICAVAVYNGVKFTSIDAARLIQVAMLIAGLGTLIQLFPIWRIGAKLPVVIGISFTFLPAMLNLASQDYGLLVGAVLIGGLIQGVLGLTAKYWRRFISPIVSGCVVMAIGFSLLSTGVNYFASSSIYEFGSWQNLLVGFITFISCLLIYCLARGFWKQLYILFGLVIGYIVSIFFHMVDFNAIGETIKEVGIISIPRFFAYTPKFDLGAIISVSLVFLVSTAETIGDTTAICTSGLGRDIKDREVSGALSCDGFVSSIAGGVFGCPPVTSFSQNVGLVAMTKVVNRFTIMCGALILIIAGLFPPIGAFFASLPDCVLGGCSIIMFGAIISSGITMLSKCKMNTRNTIIVATSFCLGIGVTQVDGFFAHMPSIIGDIFSSNPVAGVFVISMILSLVLPKDKEDKNGDNKLEKVVENNLNDNINKEDIILEKEDETIKQE